MESIENWLEYFYHELKARHPSAERYDVYVRYHPIFASKIYLDAHYGVTLSRFMISFSVNDIIHQYQRYTHELELASVEFHKQVKADQWMQSNS